LYCTFVVTYYIGFVIVTGIVQYVGSALIQQLLQGSVGCLLLWAVVACRLQVLYCVKLIFVIFLVKIFV